MPLRVEALERDLRDRDVLHRDAGRVEDDEPRRRRRGGGAARHSPSSATLSSASTPAATACWISPRSTHCARESATTRSAAATSAGSSSCLPLESAPIASTSAGRPLSQLAITSGSRAGVTVSTTSAASHAARALAQTSTSQPFARISAANASACSARRAHAVTRRQLVTDASSRSCQRACTPQPITPIDATAGGAKRRSAIAPAAAVRSSVSRPPSHRIATGARALNTSTSPLFCPPPPEATLLTKCSPPLTYADLMHACASGWPVKFASGGCPSVWIGATDTRPAEYARNPSATASSTASGGSRSISATISSSETIRMM